MDSYRPYRGHGTTSRRRRGSGTGQQDDRTARRTVKLIICVSVFVIAAFMKLIFPGTLQVIRDKLNTAVNYKAALATLGEGISGKKKFVTALGEAFTYAFTGSAPESEDNAAQPSGNDQTGAASASPQTTPVGTGEKNDTAGVNAQTASSTSVQKDSTAAASLTEESVQTFTEASPSASPGSVGAALQDKAVAGATDDATSFSDAVIAAFQQNQEQYSDYAVPAGVSYAMPKINADYTTPVKGVVSSHFGYRVHPIDKIVKFHYGTDVAADKGTSISAFADGKVISAGESTTLGNYVIINHRGVESEYAHCAKILVKSGQTVKMGDKIATVGDTGNATENCLHFELRVGGVCVNPEFYIQWT